MTIDDMGRLIPDFGMPNTAHYYIGDPPTQKPAWPSRAPAPSIAEQLGTDPVSKLAAAIHDLADAIRSTKTGDGGSGG